MSLLELFSQAIIAFEVSKQEAIPSLWLKAAVVLRTTSFVIFFLLYAGAPEMTQSASTAALISVPPY